MPNIPLNLFQTWTTKALPHHMAECVASIQRDNPEFTHHLFDDADCERFIQSHFGDRVAEAFCTLIPGAFKADLWRYCVLYVHGGIYVDIKFKCCDGFRLVAMTDSEYLCNTSSPNGVYNAIMVCLPGNTLLQRCIDQIVYHVQTEFYGTSAFEITGPCLVSRFLRPEDKTNDLIFVELTKQSDEYPFYRLSQRHRYIVFRGTYALEQYSEYFEERRQHETAIQLPYYSDLYDARNVYRKTKQVGRPKKEALVIGRIYYEALKYHMEEALDEQQLDRARATHDPPVALFSRAYYQELQALDHTKLHDYCFIGSLSTHPARRRWVVEFAKKHFTERSVFIQTDGDPEWNPLGPFDRSLENLGYNPRLQPDNQSKPVQYRRVSDNRFYFETMCRSTYVLCPAGDSPWSFRFYETLMCQSVPVVETRHHVYRTLEENLIPYRFALHNHVQEDGSDPVATVRHNTEVFEAHHLLPPVAC